MIPCLDLRDGRVVKGVRFEAIKDAGDPVELAEYYYREGADELVMYDITASAEAGRSCSTSFGKRPKGSPSPLTVGGGVSGVTEMQAVLEAGADKISINSAAVTQPRPYSRRRRTVGSQRIVLAIDARRRAGGWFPLVGSGHYRGGRTPTGMDAVEWAETGRSARAQGSSCSTASTPTAPRRLRQ